MINYLTNNEDLSDLWVYLISLIGFAVIFVYLLKTPRYKKEKTKI